MTSMYNQTMCDKHILDKRTTKDLPKTVVEAVRTVTAHMDTLPVGTFKYKVFKYPSDIDIFEKLEECCTFNQAKLKSAEEIQNIVCDIINNKTGKILFSDFKAGYDNRFKIYTGVVNGTVEDYDEKIIKRDITNLHNAKLINCCEYMDLLKHVKENPTVKDVMKLNEKLRELWVIRWSSQEIIQGFKILRGNYKLFLDVALTHGSIVKLDSIAKIEDDPRQARYVEVTNFFLISQKDKFGNVITLSEELGDYEQSLLEDFNKYYEKNLLKSIKRLWMYLAYKGRICDLSKFSKLFESDISFYSQIVGDLEVAIMLYESDIKYDKQFLEESIGRRLKQISGLCGFERLVNETKIDYLNKVKDCLVSQINSETSEWLKYNNIDLFKLSEE